MSDGLVAEDAALDHARAILDGRYVVPARQATRLAALLVRQALEAAVLVLCGPDMRRASMRCRLIYLRVLGDVVSAERACVAWDGLSRACHHHAYELAPTPGEVRHLLETEVALRTAELQERDRTANP